MRVSSDARKATPLPARGPGGAIAPHRRTRRHVLTSDNCTRAYRSGFRYGGGPVLAVARPGSLIELLQAAHACIEAAAIIIMQASDTGLIRGLDARGRRL